MEDVVPLKVLIIGSDADNVTRRIIDAKDRVRQRHDLQPRPPRTAAPAPPCLRTMETPQRPSRAPRDRTDTQGMKATASMLLVATPNLSAPGDFYEALIQIHRDLSTEECHALNACSTLLLANCIGS
jgi:hypothetical protein